MFSRARSLQLVDYYYDFQARATSVIQRKYARALTVTNSSLLYIAAVFFLFFFFFREFLAARRNSGSRYKGIILKGRKKEQGLMSKEENA